MARGRPSTKTAAQSAKGLPNASNLASLPAAEARPLDIHIDGIETNLKGLASRISLAPRTLLVGPNRAKKSAVLQAIRLGMTGYHPVGAKATDLRQLAPSDRDPLYAHLSIGTESIRYDLPPGTSVSPPVFSDGLKQLENPTIRENIIPPVSLRSIITGERLGREAIFRRFGSITSSPTTPGGLSEEQRQLWEATIRELTAGGLSGADQLAECSSRMRKAKIAQGKQCSAAEAQLKAARAQVEAQGLTATLCAQTLKETEEKYHRAVKAEGLARQRDEQTYLQRDQGVFQAQAEAFVSRYQGLHARLTEMGPRVAETWQRAPVLDQGIVAAQTQARDSLSTATKIGSVRDLVKKSAAAGKCALCQSTHFDFSKLLADLDVAATQATTAAQEAHKRVDELRAESKGLEVIRAELHQAQHDVKVADFEKANLRDRGQRLQDRLLELQQVLGEDAAYSGPTAAEMKIEVDRVRAIKDTWAEVYRLEALILKTRNEQVVTKVLESEATAMLQELLTTVETRATAAVSRYMVPGFTVKLDLEGNGCEWCVIGADGRPHGRHTMSGSEFGGLLIAVWLGWTEHAPFRLLPLDDEDVMCFDHANLIRLLEQLGSLDPEVLPQVVVALNDERVLAAVRTKPSLSMWKTVLFGAKS